MIRFLYAIQNMLCYSAVPSWKRQTELPIQLLLPRYNPSYHRRPQLNNIVTAQYV